MLNLKDSFGIIVFTQVIPGVSFFFTMMSFPVLYSFYYKIPFATNFIQLSCGICTGLMGLYIIIESFRVIGISGAAFENDYSTNNRKKLVAHSIYGLIRHPLYMGSLIGSVGLSMVFSNLECFLFPLINTAFIPIYKYLEETRLIDIYGQEYMLYQKKVGAFWPKKLFWRKATIILKSKK
ncbi:methyltransferase family protein [Hydrobacter penzbergensis]|nr:methyltransferase [Hydrobacter penzbergensis]